MDKILALNHLQSRDGNLANRCILCMEEEESVNHLFIYYSMAKGVWEFFPSHLKIAITVIEICAAEVTLMEAYI